VRVSNQAAQALYRRFGFVPAGIRKDYYPETPEDALIMWAHDIDQPPYAQRLAAITAALPGRTRVDGVAAIEPAGPA
jgi:ribosomal-protein-alanine N-acetyltransferase